MSKNDQEEHRVDREVQQTLASLNNVDDIEAGPYFYTQLKAQVDSLEQRKLPWPAKILFGSRLAPSLLALVVLLNVLSVVVILRDSTENQTEIRQQYVDAMADEYLLSETTSWLDSIAE